MFGNSPITSDIEGDGSLGEETDTASENSFKRPSTLDKNITSSPKLTSIKKTLGEREGTNLLNQSQVHNALKKMLPVPPDLGKAKFIVNIEEKEKEGRSGMRIDIWEYRGNEKEDTVIPSTTLEKTTSKDSFNIPDDSSMGSPEGNSNDSPDHDEWANGVDDFDIDTYSPPAEFLDEEAEDREHEPASAEAMNISDERTSEVDVSTAKYFVYTEHQQCAEPGVQLRHDTEIPADPPGNCFFHSIKKIMKLDQTPRQIRDRLLISQALKNAGDPAKVSEILSSNTEYVDTDCIYTFSQEFKINMCIHYHKDNGEVTYCRFTSGEKAGYIHLHLVGQHFTPYLMSSPSLVPQADENDVNEYEEHDDTDQEPNQAGPEPRQRNVLTRYLTAEGRPSDETPPWREDDPPAFTSVQLAKEHPFAYKENIAYVLSADVFLDTEILQSLIERRYINKDELLSMTRYVGEVLVSEAKGNKMFGIVIKNNIDNKPLKPDLRRCIKTFRAVVSKYEIKSLGIIRDLAVMSQAEWTIFIDECNAAFRGRDISIVFFKNNLPIPRVEDRFRLIQEYHESAIGGHKGMNKTYERLAHEYYWRNMQADVRQFVRGCNNCQTDKLVRKKTHLPMIITDTPAKPFSKISIDYVGPKDPTKLDNRYILTIQDTFSKFCVLVPTPQANAEETARALVNNLICYFGPPVTIISDQGPHFMNRLLEEFAKMFRINKFATTAYHPQSNGGIERMHHTLNEYLKMYINQQVEWDVLLPLAQHAYNVTLHEGINYSPHEVVFGNKARTPSSFPPREQLLTYGDYLAETAASLAQLRIMAGMNLVQSKYRSKYYYDQKQNIKHFREGQMVFLLKKPKQGKMDQEYVGPCEIIEINHGTHNALIRKDEKERLVHMDQLKHGYELPKPPDIVDTTPEQE